MFLVYFNLVFSYGIENFIKKCKEHGVSGLIIPDLPHEENREFFQICLKNNIALIPLVSITSEYRIDKILSTGSGFIYAIGAIGVSGSKRASKDRLKNLTKKLKDASNLPVAVGFGVKNSNDVVEVKSYCDGAIIGTAIVELTSKFSGIELINKINQLFIREEL